MTRFVRVGLFVSSATSWIKEVLEIDNERKGEALRICFNRVSGSRTTPTLQAAAITYRRDADAPLNDNTATLSLSMD